MTDKQSLVGLKPLNDRVLVFIYDDGDTSLDIGDGKRLITSLRDTEFDSLHDVTDGKHPGIRSRWAMVIGVNDETPKEIKLRDKVLLEQMKWRRGITATNAGQRVWDIAFDDILVVDDSGFTEDEKSKVDKYLEGFDEQMGATL